LDPCRVLLVDRNDDFLDGLSSLLGKERGIRIVGRAHSAREAIDRTRELAPDLVLMDVSLADMSGFRAVAWLKALRPSPLVLLLTFHFSRAVGAVALQSGADGFVCKTAVADRLLPAIGDLWPPPGEATTGVTARIPRLEGSEEREP
jgi:DNA-binding NarL/FixJ family response regulator